MSKFLATQTALAALTILERETGFFAHSIKYLKLMA